MTEARAGVRETPARLHLARNLDMSDRVWSPVLDGTAREAALAAARALDVPAARLDLPDGRGPACELDAAIVADVVTNLVTNALIAVEDRADARVHVRIEEDGGAVRIVVEDEGPGVPREVEPRLFEPFVTGRARDARRPGTGLGLAIAASVVRRLGGAIRHERPAAGGARFIVTLPRRAAVSP